MGDGTNGGGSASQTPQIPWRVLFAAFSFIVGVVAFIAWFVLIVTGDIQAWLFALGITGLTLAFFFVELDIQRIDRLKLFLAVMWVMPLAVVYIRFVSGHKLDAFYEMLLAAGVANFAIWCVVRFGRRKKVGDSSVLDESNTGSPSARG